LQPQGKEPLIVETAPLLLHWEELQELAASYSTERINSLSYVGTNPDGRLETISITSYYKLDAVPSNKEWLTVTVGFITTQSQTR
jgi:hypothetical protein